jgi:hypothetical protein
LLALQSDFFGVLCLVYLFAMVVSLIALAFPFGCTCRTEPMPGLKFSATRTVGNVLLCYWLAYPFRPSEVEYLEQIEAILFVQVSAPVLLAYLPASAFSQWSPAHERWLTTFFHIT